MAFAISNEIASKGPKTTDEGEAYVQYKNLMGTKYNLYSHSYLNYGLMTARAEFLKASSNSGNPCILSGYDGSYTYNGVTYKAKAMPSGPHINKCRELIKKVLKVDAPCKHMNCTFNGV